MQEIAKHHTYNRSDDRQQNIFPVHIRGNFSVIKAQNLQCGKFSLALRNIDIIQIVQYHKKRKNTVLLVSHSMEDIARVADRIIVMNESHLVMFDKTREVFSHGRELEKIGLRVPQITKIMLELKEKGYDVPDGILTVDEAFSAVSSLLKKEGKIW